MSTWIEGAHPRSHHVRFALGDGLELAHELAVVAWELHGEVEAHLEAGLREVAGSRASTAAFCATAGRVSHALDERLGEPVLGAELDLLGDRAARVGGFLVHAVSEAVVSDVEGAGAGAGVGAEQVRRTCVEWLAERAVGADLAACAGFGDADRRPFVTTTRLSLSI